MSTDQIQSRPPVPWRYVSRVKADGTIIYYTHHPPSRNILACISPKAMKEDFNNNELNKARYLIRQQTKIRIPHGKETKSGGSKVLLIINPRAGGHVESKPLDLSPLYAIFNEAGIAHEQMVTQKSGHARTLVTQLLDEDKLFNFDVIVPVGGDGTLHEVINGLVEVISKIDQEQICRLPIVAPVPAGTGNAVAHSLHLHTLSIAALNIVHGLREKQFKPLPLLQYQRLEKENNQEDQQPQSGPLIAICGFQWGLPADVDIGTQKYQHRIGNARFTVGALSAILKKKLSYAKIRITVDAEKQQECWGKILKQNSTLQKSKFLERGVTKVDDETYLLDGTFVQGVAWNWRLIAEGFQVTPLANVNEVDVFDFMVFQGGISRVKMLNIFTAVETGSFLNHLDGFRYFKAKSVTFEQIEGKFLTVDGETVPLKPFTLELAKQSGVLKIIDTFSEE